MKRITNDYFFETIRENRQNPVEISEKINCSNDRTHVKIEGFVGGKNGKEKRRRIS